MREEWCIGRKVKDRARSLGVPQSREEMEETGHGQGRLLQIGSCLTDKKTEN
jgi:hypothetical protein